VYNVEGNLATPNIINAIIDLYSNLPIEAGIEIYIKGETELINGFLRNVDTVGCETIANNLGYEYIKFVVDNDDISNKCYRISTPKYTEELENILINYI
jgi:hypothetical protein